MFGFLGLLNLVAFGVVVAPPGGEAQGETAGETGGEARGAGAAAAGGDPHGAQAAVDRLDAYRGRDAAPRAGSCGDHSFPGGAGDDTLFGGAEPDAPFDGDDEPPCLGAGGDRPVLGDWPAADDRATIPDFDPAWDRIEVHYDPARHPDPVVALLPGAAPDAVYVALDGEPLVLVLNGVGLTPAAIELVRLQA